VYLFPDEGRDMSLVSEVTIDAILADVELSVGVKLETRRYWVTFHRLGEWLPPRSEFANLSPESFRVFDAPSISLGVAIAADITDTAGNTS